MADATSPHPPGNQRGVGREGDTKRRDRKRSVFPACESISFASCLEIPLHRPSDQFAQVAAGIPRPITILLYQVGVDSDGQLLPPLGLRGRLPRRSADPGMAPPFRVVPGREPRRFGRFGFRRIVRDEPSEHTANAGNRRLLDARGAIM